MLHRGLDVIRVLGEVNQSAVQFHVPSKRGKALAQHRLDFLLADVQSSRIRDVWRGGKRIGGGINLAHDPVVPVIEAPGDGRIVGSELFEEAQILEDFLGARAQARSASRVIRCFLINDAVGNSATGEVTGERETHRSRADYEDIGDLCLGHGSVCSFSVFTHHGDIDSYDG